MKGEDAYMSRACDTSVAPIAAALLCCDRFPSTASDEDIRRLLTLQIRGDGPIQGLTVTADAAGRVKTVARLDQPQTSRRIQIFIINTAAGEPPRAGACKAKVALDELLARQLII